jgi:hypothetical protein
VSREPWAITCHRRPPTQVQPEGLSESPPCGSCTLPCEAIHEPNTHRPDSECGTTSGSESSPGGLCADLTLSGRLRRKEPPAIVDTNPIEFIPPLPKEQFHLSDAFERLRYRSKFEGMVVTWILQHCHFQCSQHCVAAANLTHCGIVIVS